MNEVRTTVPIKVSRKGMRGAPKGTMPPSAGRGRKKGEKNRISKSVVDGILGAYQNMGGQEWLEQLGKRKPELIIALLKATIPRDINMTMAGKLSVNLDGAGVGPRH